MLTGHLDTRRRAIRAQDGFTLPELLVAMAMGMIVLVGLVTLMTFTMDQTQTTFSGVSATRQARTALANIENELHSACVDGSPPIQAGSTATKLVFISYYGSAAAPTPVWHVITFNATSGTLTDTSYAVTANATYDSTGVPPAWTPASTATSTTTLLTNVSAQASGTPVFQYYEYAADGTDPSGDTYMIIPDGTNLAPGQTGTPPNNPLNTSVTGGLSQAYADNTVEVMINLRAGPALENLNSPSETSADDSVTDAISLRLTTPPDYVPAGATAEGYGPCE